MTTSKSGPALALIFLLVSACATNDPAQVNQQPSYQTASCRAGESCECFPGYTSIKVCPNPDDLGDRGVCDCNETCKPLHINDAPTWEACGGEPFGRWRSTAVNFDGLPFQLTVDQRTIAAACPARFADFDYDVRMEIDNDRAVVIKEGKSLRLEYFPKSCNKFTSNVLTSCDAVMGCKSTDCGRCECSKNINSVSREGTWARMPNKLQLPGFEQPVEYCVRNDRLEIRDPLSGRYSFERFYGGGSPAECAERTMDDCKSSGCSLGVCRGGPSCDRANVTQCGTRQGCTWDPTVCTGQAATACALQDYGKEPGCVLYPGAAKCGSTATACSGRASVVCKFGCAVCDGSMASCKAGACGGQATPCADLSEFDCLKAPGCLLEGK
jgi:hypothetical protein